MDAFSKGDLNMQYLYYALITVVCWGTYGVCMHIGSSNMGDKENGRIMAFLWVGLAYFLTAVVAPLIILEAQGWKYRLLDLSHKGLAMVAYCGDARSDWSVGRVACLWEDAFTRLCSRDHVHHLCRGSYGERNCEYN